MIGQTLKIKRLYGWRPDLPDQRDIIYPAMAKPIELPILVDLRAKCSPVVDQGQLGSCTANAISAHLDFNRKQQGKAFIAPSRLQIYYNERLDQGTVGSDAGSTIRESAKAVKKYGAAPESEWVYDISKFKTAPPSKVVADGLKYKDLVYERITRSLVVFQTRLAEGFPFVIGFTVYDSFESDVVAKTGVMPMPASGESVLGGHAVMVVGYDNAKRQFIVRNSWGTDWGDKGYFYMPYEYLLNPGLSSDFWTLTKVL